MKNTAQLPKPNIKEVEKYLNQWEKLENYTLQESALNKLLALLPEILKAASINDFYSTNIFAIYTVAKHILTIKDIDERIKSVDVSLVNEISKIQIITKDNETKDKNFYSFATKYCSHHNQEMFPIYDSYVEKVLWYYQKAYRFADFKKASLKNYVVFKDVLLKFKVRFGLEAFDLKQLDRYLWLLGKEYFGKY